VNGTYHHRLIGYIGQNDVDKLTLNTYSDADFAGCRFTKRSTSGGYLCIEGPNTLFALSFCSKRQGAVSHSTPEAEIVAADHVLRVIGIPSLNMWQVLFRSGGGIIFHEDNETAIRILKTGRNLTMRHIGRTHEVDIAWLAERFKDPIIELVYAKSASMRADIFTKGFTSLEKWEPAIALISVVDFPVWLANPMLSTGGVLELASAKGAAAAAVDKMWIQPDPEYAGTQFASRKQIQDYLINEIQSVVWPDNRRGAGVDSKATCLGATFGPKGAYLSATTFSCQRGARNKQRASPRHVPNC
jgi:hypothetical protein